MKAECEQFDDYLDAGRAVEHLHPFEQHLLSCETCREAVRQQHWIDDLLHSRARLQLEPIPAQLTSHLQRPVPYYARRLQIAVCCLAASLLIAAGLFAIIKQHADTSNASNSIQGDPKSPTAQAAASYSLPPTFVSDENTITVPLTSTASDVAVVQVYPTLETERRWHRELVLQSTQRKSNGG